MATRDEIDRQIAAFTAGNDPNPGGRFSTGAYLTPDEAQERGVGWVARPGEPQDLRDPYHYQTPDEARSIGMNWGTQPSFRGATRVDPGATMGALLGMSNGMPVSRTTPQPNGLPPGALTLGSMIQPRHVAAPDWRYLAR